LSPGIFKQDMRNTKRLFLAVDLPEELKDRLHEVQREWSHFPARWVRRNILHVTFAFLGEVEEKNLPSLMDALAGVLKAHPLTLTVEDIQYGPDKRRPRLIWARTKESQELTSLYEALLARLKALPFKVYLAYKRPAHITLARFNNLNLRGWEEDELPFVEQKIDYTFTVSAIELIESKLRRGGPEYFVLHSFILS